MSSVTASGGSSSATFDPSTIPSPVASFAEAVSDPTVLHPPSEAERRSLTSLVGSNTEETISPRQSYPYLEPLEVAEGPKSLKDCLWLTQHALANSGLSLLISADNLKYLGPNSSHSDDQWSQDIESVAKCVEEAVGFLSQFAQKLDPSMRNPDNAWEVGEFKEAENDKMSHEPTTTQSPQREVSDELFQAALDLAVRSRIVSWEPYIPKGPQSSVMFGPQSPGLLSTPWSSDPPFTIADLSANERAKIDEDRRSEAALAYFEGLHQILESAAGRIRHLCSSKTDWRGTVPVEPILGSYVGRRLANISSKVHVIPSVLRSRVELLHAGTLRAPKETRQTEMRQRETRQKETHQMEIKANDLFRACEAQSDDALAQKLSNFALWQLGPISKSERHYQWIDWSYRKLSQKDIEDVLMRVSREPSTQSPAVSSAVS